MSMALIVFRALSGAGFAVAAFLRKYWVQISVILFCLGLVLASYNWGYSDADTKWIRSSNKATEALNAKIANLETTSQKEIDGYRSDVKLLQARLHEILTATPDITVHDANGAELKCDSKKVTAYLGSDFTKTWNKINKESNK